MKPLAKLLLCMSLLGCGAGVVRAADAPGAHLQVYLMTIGPGEELWAKFGHDALWIHDPDAGTDNVYNYGMFDFEAAHFYENFILGTMHYWMQGFDVVSTVEFYKSLHRSIWVQELNLTAPQKLQLDRFLQWNARPANKYYHYDYYLDNCATRVRDALDRALDGQLKAQTADVPTPFTYRDFTRRDMIHYPFVYTALEFILGQPVDRPLTQWQLMYLPMHVQAIIRHVKVRDEAGQLIPLVARQATLNEGQWPMPPDTTPSLWGGYLGIAMGLGLLFVLLGWAGAGATSPGRWARWGMGILGVVWMLLLGSAGLFLAWGELFTGHVAIDHNENLLHFCPAAIVGIVLIPAMIRGKHWAMMPGWLVLALVVACGGVGLLLKSFPFFYQSNWGMIALTLPANVGLLAGMILLARHVRPPIRGASLGIGGPVE